MNSFVTCILFVAMMTASSIWCASVIRRVAQMKIKACFVLISFGVSLLSLVNLLKCTVTPDTTLQTVLTAFYALPTLIILISAIVAAVAVGKACRGKNLPVMPVLLIAVMLIYSVLYVLDVPFISDSPLNIINGALIILLCESCISPRLFKTGADYCKMLEGSSIPVVVTDKDMEIVYRTKAVVPDSASIRSAIENGIEYKPNEDFILTAQRVDGGFAVFTKEIKELNMLLDELNETSQQLQRSNELIAREGEIRQELTHAKVLNRLYEDSVSVCVGKLNCVAAIVRSLPNDKFARSNMLLRAKLLTSYVKSKFEMLSCIEQSNKVAAEVFLGSVQELSEILSGIVSECDIRIDSFREADSRITMLMFDWLESLSEFAVLFANSVVRAELLDNQKAFLLCITLEGLDAHKKFEVEKELVRKTSAYSGRVALDVLSSRVIVKIQLPTEVM
ncbi:MAG: hypothetical protein IKY44_02285 [Clostridia bacterium]|nr:hypothetical protein [Clostridia bacterium]